MEQHPLAKEIPPCTQEELADLCKSLEENGYDERQPIYLYEGKVLDGWSRQGACEKTGVKPVYVEYAGSSPLHFVVQRNLTRRHLTASQLGWIATNLMEPLEEEARNRQAQNLKKGHNLPTPPIGGLGTSAARAAVITGASQRSVERAKQVMRDGDEETKKAVADGKMSLNKAAKKIKRKRGDAEEPPSWVWVDRADEAIGKLIRALDALGLGKQYKPILQPVYDEIRRRKG